MTCTWLLVPVMIRGSVWRYYNHGVLGQSVVKGDMTFATWPEDCQLWGRQVVVCPMGTFATKLLTVDKGNQRLGIFHEQNNCLPMRCDTIALL